MAAVRPTSADPLAGAVRRLPRRRFLNKVTRAGAVRLPSPGHGSWFDGRLLGETMLSATLVAATIGAVAAAAYVGMLREALVVVVTLLAIPVLVKRPLVLLLAYLLVYTNLFETLPLRDMTAVEFGGFVLTVQNALILLMLVVAAVRLQKRHQRPMFLVFAVLWCAYVAFQLIYRYILGDTVATQTLLMPLARTQDLAGWVLYLLMVALIDSRRDLRVFGWFYLGMMVVAVLYQVAEYAHGSRLLLFHVSAAGDSTSYYVTTQFLDAGGTQIPYLWSRAVGANQVGFLLAFAAVIAGRRFLVWASLTAAGLLGILLTQIRGIYFAVAVGTVAVLVLTRIRTERVARVLALLCVIALAVVLVTPVVRSSFGGDPVGAIVKRASMLSGYSSQQNWIKRVGDVQKAWGGLKESPVVGFGWGGASGKFVGETGMNVLLTHGLLGTFMILVMYFVVMFKAVRLARRIRPCLEQAWLFGVVGLLVMELANTPQSDSLTTGGFAVLAAVFVDRISAFEADGSLEDTSVGRWEGDQR